MIDISGVKKDKGHPCVHGNDTIPVLIDSIQNDKTKRHNRPSV